MRNLRNQPLWIGLQRRLTNRRIWRDSGLLMLSNVIVIGLGVIRLPVVTRILTKEEVGMLGIVASILPFLQLLSLSGMDGASYHYIAKGHPRAIWVNVLVRFRWSIAATIAVILGALYYGWVRNEVLVAWLLIVSAVTLPFTVGLSNLAGYFAARERFVTLFWYRVVEALSRYAGVITLLVVPAYVFRVVLFSLTNQLVLTFLLTCLALWLYRQMAREELPVMPRPEQIEMIKYGKQLTFLNVISTFQSRIDGLLVATLLPLNVIADYSIALLVYSQFKSLWQVYYSIRYPAFVRFEGVQRRRRMSIEMVVVFLGFAGLWVIGFIGLTFLIPILFPAEYSSSLPFIGWLMGAFAVSVPAYFAEIYFRTFQNEAYQFRLRGYSAFFNILLPILFFQFWQAEGIVIGRFSSGIVMALIAGYFVRQFNKTKENNDL